jgi:RIO kinase 1
MNSGRKVSSEWIRGDTVPRRRNYDEESDRLERAYEEDALFKEKDHDDLQVIEEVFDRLTLQGLLRFFKRGVMTRIHGVVKAGKEARVYYATNADGRELAVKIYYTHTAEFRKGMMQYIEGDPRFKRVRSSQRALIYTWTQKEFNNLQLCEEANVNVPRPIDFYRNILVMTFIGENGISAPLLREIDPTEPVQLYETILNQMYLMWQSAGLAHGDLSEYNIMIYDDQPVIFDVSQAMLTIHPMANILIERDIQNINQYFSRLSVETRDPEELKEWITGGTEDLH